MIYRPGNNSDVEQLRLLGLATWKQFQSDFTPANWQKLFSNLNCTETYVELLAKSQSVIC